VWTALGELTVLTEINTGRCFMTQGKELERYEGLGKKEEEKPLHRDKFMGPDFRKILGKILSLA